MGAETLRLFARMGYGARGVVYLIIGGLAALAALDAGGETTDSRGALVELLSQPFGAVLIAIVIVGLLGYAGWRVVQALLDADAHGLDAKGLVVRAGLFISAITYSALAFYAMSLIFMSWTSDGGGSARVSWLMQQSFGRYLMAAVGLAIGGAGLAQIWKGAAGGFHRHLELDRGPHPVISFICGFGLIARGAVFCIIGGLFCLAAVRLDPEQAGGLKDAMNWLRQQPFGEALFAIVALGLFAFGVYSLIEAAFRKIDIADDDGS